MRNPHRGNLWEIKLMHNPYSPRGGSLFFHTAPVAVPDPPVRGRDSDDDEALGIHEIADATNALGLHEIADTTNALGVHEIADTTNALGMRYIFGLTYWEIQLC